MPNPEIAALETQIFELTTRLKALRQAEVGDSVPNYTFATQSGKTTLLDLFGENHTLLVIHNMGQGCR
ncbi:MAG: DUF899 domain-containing protein, partial [Gammaproteobacteria bacterium]|nr:DUF899 domain-containing protein [Gammaproteobacteria bacterium]